MWIWMVSTALAGILWEESELQSECLAEGYCLLVTGEVIDAECRSSTKDDEGVIVRQFSANIVAIEASDDFAEGTEITLHTESWDFSESDDGMGCSLYDPGHPVGEVARYYLNIESTDGAYALYGSETFFQTDDSDPDPEPLCDELDEAWKNSGDDTGTHTGTHEGDAEGSTSTDDKGSGCAVATGSPGAWIWIAGLVGLLTRRQTS